MSFWNKKTTIATHDGRYHADDLFACATLQIVLDGKGAITRTRDQKIIDASDYVVDVGAVNDASLKRFDHHQSGGAGIHANGILYASFGLVWKEYGEKICGSKDIAERVEEKLVTPIDAEDNGISLVTATGEVFPYSFQSFLGAFRPTWKEDAKMYDESFAKLVPLAQEVILREVIIARDAMEAEHVVATAYENASDKRLIELDGNYPYQETLIQHPEPLYVVMPRQTGSVWKVECVRKAVLGFENRKPFPVSWAGLRDAELSKVTGVPDSVFCHNGRFLAVAKSKEGALALAKLALQA